MPNEKPSPKPSAMPLAEPPPLPPAPTLAHALCRAQGDASSVRKDATNTYDHYAYASAEAIILVARAALSRHGLCVLPVSSIPDDAGTSILCTYRLLHVSGESLEIRYETPICVNPKRPGTVDKATAAARTYTLGYMLRDLLLLPRVSADEDIDARDDREGVERPAPRPQRPALAQLAEETEDSLRIAQSFADALGQVATLNELPALEAKVRAAVDAGALTREQARKLGVVRDSARARIARSQEEVRP